MLGLIVIAIYFAAMIVIGLASRRRARGADNFFVAGRSGSSLFITGSLLATIVGGSATVGMAGLGFSRGLTGQLSETLMPDTFHSLMPDFPGLPGAMPTQALGYRTPAEVFTSTPVEATNGGMVESLTPDPLRIAGPTLNIAPILS